MLHTLSMILILRRVSIKFLITFNTLVKHILLNFFMPFQLISGFEIFTCGRLSLRTPRICGSTFQFLTPIQIYITVMLIVEFEMHNVSKPLKSQI